MAAARRHIPAGTVFGRLTVLSEVVGGNRPRLRCRCQCGTVVVTRKDCVTRGEAASCGCLQKERQVASVRTHGEEGSPEYIAWSGMRARCNNPSASSYGRYGGRGIRICERWNSFDLFLADMGRKPSAAHSLDRIDNSGNYEPGNCRWASDQQQARNRRNNRLFVFYGKSMTITEWSAISQVPVVTILNRLNRGWSEQCAVWSPRVRRAAA